MGSQKQLLIYCHISAEREENGDYSEKEEHLKYVGLFFWFKPCMYLTVQSCPVPHGCVLSLFRQHCALLQHVTDREICLHAIFHMVL